MSRKSKAKAIEARRTRRLHDSTFSFTWEDVYSHTGRSNPRPDRRIDREDYGRLDSESLVDLVDTNN